MVQITEVTAGVYLIDLREEKVEKIGEQLAPPPEVAPRKLSYYQKEKRRKYSREYYHRVTKVKNHQKAMIEIGNGANFPG